MDKKAILRAFTPVIIIFILTSLFMILVPAPLERVKIDPQVLLAGNVILFLVVAVSFYFYNGALRNNKPAVFFRFIYGAMFFKMLTCALAAFIYISLAGKGVNKGAIFACVFLYFIYTFVEISAVMKLSRQNKNA